MSDNLLPCPFCGNEKNIAIANEKHDHSGGYFIACPACDASTGLRYAMGDDPRPLLVEQWNRRAALAQAQSLPAELPSNCDGKEQEAFEQWAIQNRYDMTCHPLHYLFSDQRTDAARNAWKAGLTYSSEIARGLLAASPAQPVQAQSLPAGWKQAVGDLIFHIDEVLPGPALGLISNDKWNAVTSLLAASPAQPVQPSDMQWQKRHPLRTEGNWENTNEHDAKWWRDNSQGWEIRVLYAIPPAPQPKD